MSTDTERRVVLIEETIDRWGRDLIKFQREGWLEEAEQIRNWLCGASIALGMIDQIDLAKRAGDAALEIRHIREMEEAP